MLFLLQLDPNSRIQYEKSSAGPCDSEMVQCLQICILSGLWSNLGSSWDLGGQPRFRSMWERYCRGVNAIVYAVSIKASSLIKS